MTPQARSQLSQSLLQRSDDEFDSRGNTHIASELLWGAAAQLLRTVIDTDATLDFTGHDSYRQAARRAEALSAEPFEASDYNAANRLHIHFYQGQLTDQDLKYVRRVTKRLISRLNAYLEQPALRPSTGPLGNADSEERRH